MKKNVLFVIMLGAAMMFASCGSTEEVKTEEVATEAPVEVTAETTAPAVVDSAVTAPAATTVAEPAK